MAGACLEAPPGAVPDECSPAALEPGDPTIGDVLTYTFDGDTTELEVVHDASGNRLDGALEGAAIAATGQYGRAAESTAGTFSLIEVPSHPLLHLGDTFTLELWVRRSRLGTAEGLLGVTDQDTGRSEVAFEITPEDGLELVTSQGACGEVPSEVSVVAPATAIKVPMDRWTHVAVAWDGEEASFFLDGELAYQAPFTASPCAMDRTLTIGATARSRLPFDGAIDEVKISSWAKDEDDVRASKEHDSSLAAPRCGDGLVEGDEQCEPPAACCDPATCRLAESTCTCGGCFDGVCMVEEPGRVEDALIALYDFEEGTGTMVFDSAGVGPALVIAGSDYEWGAGSLILGGTDAALQSGDAADMIVDRIRDSGELSVEVWFTPLDLAEDEQFILSLGFGVDCLGLSVVQDRDRLYTSTGTDATRTDGEPGLDAPDLLVEGRRTHLVLTRSAGGVRRLHVDGRLRSQSLSPGSFGSWDPAQRLAVGGPVVGVSDEECESGQSAFWHGEVHRIALHARALDELEVAQNFLAGALPDPAALRPPRAVR